MTRMERNLLPGWLGLIAIAALMVMPALAALRIVEEAHELTQAQILRWPLGNGDQIVFRRCASCATETLKLTARTRFSNAPNGPEISLDELLRQKTRLRAGQSHLIVVFFTPDTREMTRLVLQMED